MHFTNVKNPILMQLHKNHFLQALPNTRMMDLFVIQIQHESFLFDAVYNTSLFNSSFQNLRYIRGTSI